MKLKAVKELHTKTVEELQVLLQTAAEELSLLRFDQAQGKLKNTSSFLHKRKDIARIQTVLREKENVK